MKPDDKKIFTFRAGDTGKGRGIVGHIGSLDQCWETGRESKEVLPTINKRCLSGPVFFHIDEKEFVAYVHDHPAE